MTTRECAISARTAATNQLKALVVTAPDQLRERLRHLTSGQLLIACLRLRPGQTASIEDSARQTAMRRLARRIQDLTFEIEAADKDIDSLTRQHVPDLLDQRGIGPITAAQAWISWSGPGRFRHEGAFASLAGVCPIPASSGKNQRHRLNRHGDRALNRALHSIVTTMERCDPDTHAYIAKRTAEGKTRREIRRCLKRYTARKIFRLLERAPTLATTS